MWWLGLIVVFGIVIAFWRMTAEAGAKAQAEAEAQAKVIDNVVMQSKCRKCGERIAERLFAQIAGQYKPGSCSECKCKHCSFRFQPDINDFCVLGHGFAGETSSHQSLYIPELDLLLHLMEFKKRESEHLVVVGVAVCFTLPEDHRAEQASFLSKPLGKYLQEKARTTKTLAPSAIPDIEPQRIVDEVEPISKESQSEHLGSSSASKPSSDAVDDTTPKKDYW